MPNFTAGTSFTDGVTNDVTAEKLRDLVEKAVPTSNLALASTSGTISLFSSGTGTAATPAIQPIGDTNTGIFFPAADTIAFAEGGTESMRIDSNGNVTVGGASIDTLRYLDVSNTNSSANAGSILRLITRNVADSSNIAVDIVKYKTGGFTIANTETSSSAFTSFNVGASERLRIDSSGNVGIGTASPATKLHVNGLNSTARFYTNGDAAGATLYLQDSQGNSGNGGQILFGASQGAFAGIKSFIEDGTGPAGTLIFQTRSTSGNVLERMSIDSVGNVAITGLAGAGSRAVNASAAGALSAASDASLKEEVVGAHIAGLNEILQIHPKMYRWKDDIANRGENASIELGFIANDVAPIIPSAAPLGNDGLYGFYDRSITAALVKAVQELKSENDSLRSRIEALEAK